MAHSRMKEAEGRVNVQAWYCGDITVATAEFLGQKFYGSARKRSEDKYDLDVADNLAVGRALKALSDHHLRLANGEVKHNDDIRSRKKNKKPEVATPQVATKIRVKR
jgi:hypothetical protein